ncbi:MAG: UDP-N-acetylmuramate dehydrogenase [Thermodesulfovibrionales bacterium]
MSKITHQPSFLKYHNLMGSSNRYYSDLFRFLDNSGIRFIADVPLSSLSYVKIGGVADCVVTPKPTEVSALIRFLNEHQLPYHIVGGGSNTLFSDDGFRGVILSLRAIKGVYLNNDENTLLIYGGEGLSRVVFFAQRLGLTGIENLAGIPGSMGGAIIGNAGAFGVSVGDVLSSVEIIDSEGQIHRMGKEDMGFSYRSSGLPNGCIITRAILKLSPTDKEVVKEKTKEYLHKKWQSQPVKELSLGCVFKNPIGYFAGKLIDDAGCKGMSEGAIFVSQRHANFFINRGGGTAADYLRLIDKVRERVFREFGIVLDLEIRVVGSAI